MESYYIGYNMHVSWWINGLNVNHPLATCQENNSQGKGKLSMLSTRWWPQTPHLHPAPPTIVRIRKYYSGYLVERGHYYRDCPSGVHVLTQNGHQRDTERSVRPLSSRVLVPTALSASQDRQSLEERVRTGKKANVCWGGEMR